jgi:spermidine synthase
MANPWETLASVSTAEGPLALLRRGEKDFLITIKGRVLMTSAAHRSEDALAKLACGALRNQAGARVLVSGLGMGFTLRAALDELAADAEVVVAELNAVVVEWCEGPLGPLTAGAARDPRVTIEITNVAHLLARVAEDARAPRFDAIVLDMHEGPQTNVRPNDPLYGPAAVLRTRKALAASGVFAVWCEGPSPGFEQSLRAAGLHYERVRAGHGARIHHVYVARTTATRPTATRERPTGPTATRERAAKPRRVR